MVKMQASIDPQEHGTPAPLDERARGLQRLQADINGAIEHLMYAEGLAVFAGGAVTEREMYSLRCLVESVGDRVKRLRKEIERENKR